MNKENEAAANDVALDPGPKGPSYPVKGEPEVRTRDDNQSGGGTDPGPKNPASYPVKGK